VADFLVVKPARIASPAELMKVIIEESQIEEVYLNGELLRYAAFKEGPMGYPG
jgi:hypothetical protein